MTVPAIDKSDILDQLTTVRVLEEHDIKVRRSGREWRSDECPRCGTGSKGRGKFATNGHQFLCHACGFRGDVLTLVGELAGLDPRRNFPAVVAAAGELAGITPTSISTTDERARRKAERERRRTEEERVAAETRAAAEARAPVYWAKLATTSAAGLEYLRSRGLEGTAGEVRFPSSAIAVPLRAFDGIIMNVVTRRIGPGHKPKGLLDCSNFGTFGDATKMDATAGPVVIVEGLADWLSARVLWPFQLVIGAHGAGRLPDIALLVGARAAEARRGLIFVPHRDDTGVRHVDRAIDQAVEAGVPIERIEVFDVGEPHNDLNDHLRAVRA